MVQSFSLDIINFASQFRILRNEQPSHCVSLALSTISNNKKRYSCTPIRGKARRIESIKYKKEKKSLVYVTQKASADFFFMLNPSLKYASCHRGHRRRALGRCCIPLVGPSQSTTNRYGEKTMLRFAARATSARQSEKCLDKSVRKRELTASTTILDASSRSAAHEPSRLRCLIDSGTRSNDTEGRRRRGLSTASTATPTATTPRKTCLYDLHVENRGESISRNTRNIRCRFDREINRSVD